MIVDIKWLRASWGDSKVPFCFQSTGKPFNYAIAASDLGTDYVHKFVGQEPSGRTFNDICLDSNSSVNASNNGSRYCSVVIPIN